MTRVILTVGCVGKTYLDDNYVNVYDFDKHTLDYKYDKTGYEHLTNEEFKSLPGRVIKDGWFERYMEDWCKVIDSEKYDVVTGWLQEDCVDYLVDKGYKLEVVLVDVDDNEEVYKERSISRGNSQRYWNNLREYYDSTLSKYSNRKDVKSIVFKVPYYLSDYLLFTGVVLEENKGHKVTYAERTSMLIFEIFEKKLSKIYMPFYTQLVLTAVVGGFKLTNEMIHDAWSMATITETDCAYHKSLLPYDVLSKETQDLDTYYTKKLNEIVSYLLTLKNTIRNQNKEK